jgi:hypothetical protein
VENCNANFDTLPHAVQVCHLSPHRGEGQGEGSDLSKESPALFVKRLSRLLFRNDDSTVGLALGEVLGQWTRRRPG